jgi:hypothetical protein
MLEIEFEPPSISRCSCCGGRITRLTRFVSQDGDAYAVYYAKFSEHHAERYVDLLVSTGEWADDAPPSGRFSFYLRIYATATNYQTTVYDAAQSPWGKVDIFGRTLDREEALKHPRIEEVFHICDHIVREDTPVIDFLSETSKGAQPNSGADREPAGHAGWFSRLLGRLVRGRSL